MKSLDSEIIIIGGGITGLMCAASLRRAGKEFLLLESGSKPGGRIQTYHHRGFLLDAGFQTYLTSYDEGDPFLQPSALNLRHFVSGAYIADGRNLSYMGDPVRNPSGLLETIQCPSAGLKDRWLIWELSQRLLKKTDQQIWSSREISSMQYLQELGFSSSMIDQFLRPFFGGVFLDNELTVSSRLFEFLFKKFATGYASLPEQGMEAIPRALADYLSQETVLLNTPIGSLDGNQVQTVDGRVYRAKKIVCALDEHAASKLLKKPTTKSAYSTSVYYFSSRHVPLKHQAILLNSSGKGVIQHLCFPSQVQPNYAPADYHLVSVTLTCDEGESYTPSDPDSIREEAKGLIQCETDDSEFLREFHVPRALPKMESMPGPGCSQHSENVWIAGDYLSYPSINGALYSGKLVAQKLS